MTEQTTVEKYRALKSEAEARIAEIDAQVPALVAERAELIAMLGHDPAKKKPGPVKGSKRKKKEVTTEPT